MAAVCFSIGTEIAQPLLRQMNTTGALDTPAKFMPTWNSPVDDVPSPKKAMRHVVACRCSWRMAVPTACGIWVPTGELIDT